MRLDIRYPIGWMFSAFGLIITGYGLFADAAAFRRSLGINIDFWWGLVLLVFGAAMLLLARASAGTKK